MDTPALHPDDDGLPPVEQHHRFTTTEAANEVTRLRATLRELLASFTDKHPQFDSKRSQWVPGSRLERYHRIATGTDWTDEDADARTADQPELPSSAPRDEVG
jgi:hypothetical protein